MTKVTAMARERGRALAFILGISGLAAMGLVPVTAALATDEADSATEVERLTTENEELKRRLEELEDREGAATRSLDDANEAGDVVVPAARPAAADAARLTTITGPGTRTVSTGASRLEVTRGSSASQWVAFRYERAGEQPVRDITMDVHTQFSGSIYRSAKTLELSVDGDRIECPVTNYDSRAVTGGGTRRRVSRDHEEVTVTIPVTTLHRMATAKAVTGSLGAVAFELTRDQIASLRALDGTVGN
jgi:hypothetical protein